MISKSSIPDSLQNVSRLLTGNKVSIGPVALVVGSGRRSRFGSGQLKSSQQRRHFFIVITIITDQ